MIEVLKMQPLPNNQTDEFEFTPEHQMLLKIRDALYEGSWEDFIDDLQARENGRPHVFQTVATSAGFKETIEIHLGMIDRMQQWEKCAKRKLVDQDLQT